MHESKNASLKFFFHDPRNPTTAEITFFEIFMEDERYAYNLLLKSPPN